MGFSQITFLFVFMPACILVYFAVDRLFRKDSLNNAVLVLFSLLFYYWGSKETFVLFLQIALFTYMAGYMCRQERRFPVIVLLGVLFFFKYAVFISGVFEQLTQKRLLTLDGIVAPIGISFAVFEAISYVTDISRGDAEPGNLLECFTYLSLFPKLVSGPIVLWRDFKPQLKNRTVDLSKVSSGIDRIIIGYAKKVIVADTFGLQISEMTSLIANGGADIPTVWLRAVLYCFQLYLDFSGYSDIAIGLCSIFGFNFKENFNYPYLSKSITEFWRRWHISLGTWFREYVYIPMGGNKKGNMYLHLAVVFLLTGIWHGAGLHFALWGGIHALYIVIERAIQNKKWYKKIPGWIKWLLTFAVVFFSWILFMANDLPGAWENYRQLFVHMTAGPVNFTWRYYLSGRTLVFLAITLVCGMTGIEKINLRINAMLATKNGCMIKRVFLLLLFVVDILYVVSSTYSPFLYFQF